MNMRKINYVDSEGGPLLLVDADLGSFWKGIESEDYDRACKFFDSNPHSEGGGISIGHSDGLLWEMNGAGTAYVFSDDDNRVVIVRTWPNDILRSDIPELMASELPDNLKKIGELKVASGFLLILWAAESGECVNSGEGIIEGRPVGDFAIETSGAIIRLQPAQYECWHDEIVNEFGIARRCHICRK